jgi:hypothetical protein
MSSATENFDHQLESIDGLLARITGRCICGSRSREEITCSREDVYRAVFGRHIELQV